MKQDRTQKCMVSKKEAVYYLLIPAFAFSDVLNNGNLNLLYFAGILLTFLMLPASGSRSRYYQDLLTYFLPFVSMPFFYLLCSGRTLYFVKALVYCAKIFICVSLLSFFKNSPGQDFQLKKLWTGLIGIFSGFLVLSLAFYAKRPFWRVHDAYNTFSRTRLQFLYSEPSVLGLITGILLIFVLYSLIENGFSLRRLFSLTSLGATLLLTFSMSGILYLSIAVLYLLTSKIFHSGGRLKKRILWMLLGFVASVAFVLLTDNAISSRLASILQGNDSSFHFRWEASGRSLALILQRTNYWGLGLGGMNTETGLSELLAAGIDYKFANSFLYVIAENGWPGALYILYLSLLCFYPVLTERSRDRKKHTSLYRLKMALFLYIFISQIAGGYFTDPLLWCIYGILCSRKLRQEELII